MLKQVPNAITALNILSGCIAVLFAVSGNLILASLFVLLGIFFDFFDGFAARLLNAQSEIGLQLDSLADVITSGVVPGIMVFQLLNLSLFGSMRNITDVFDGNGWNLGFNDYLPFLGLLIIVASAYRLAKFNVDTRQTSSFIGLPTPANAIFILSLPLILQFQFSELAESIILNKWFLIALIPVSCYMLNAEIPLFALKFKTWDFKSNAVRYIFLGTTLLLLVLLQFVAIPLVIVFYVLLSIFWKDPKEEIEVEEMV